jgi:hypothetical protein
VYVCVVLVVVLVLDAIPSILTSLKSKAERRYVYRAAAIRTCGTVAFPIFRMSTSSLKALRSVHAPNR